MASAAAAEKDSFTSFAAMHVAFVDVVVDFVSVVVVVVANIKSI